jgi:hypothetical protein
MQRTVTHRKNGVQRCVRTRGRKPTGSPNIYHSIVSGTCKCLKDIAFFSGRTEFTVRYNVENTRLRAIGGDR